MTSEPNPGFQRIIIRQEVILPYPWPGAVDWTAEQATDSAPAAPADAAMRARSPQPAMTPIPRLRTAHFISSPGSSFPCTGSSSPPLNNGYVTATGHSDCNGNGPVKLRAKCFSVSQAGVQTTILPDSTWEAVDASSGQYLNPDWSIDVPVATFSGCNFLFVLAWFNGQSDWARDNCEFPVNLSGTGPAPVQTPLAAAPVDRDAPPPATFVVQVATGPADSELSSIRLSYDRFCSSPEQPIWRSCPRQAEGEWILKASRYGTQLIGILVSRGSTERIWLTDQFDLASSNKMFQEGRPGSVAQVTPG